MMLSNPQHCKSLQESWATSARLYETPRASAGHTGLCGAHPAKGRSLLLWRGQNHPILKVARGCLRLAPTPRGSGVGAAPQRRGQFPMSNGPTQKVTSMIRTNHGWRQPGPSFLDKMSASFGASPPMRDLAANQRNPPASVYRLVSAQGQVCQVMSPMTTSQRTDPTAQRRYRPRRTFMLLAWQIHPDQPSWCVEKKSFQYAP
jgi:hypothetical protein